MSVVSGFIWLRIGTSYELSDGGSALSDFIKDVLYFLTSRETGNF
jgi:hypothetical protein